MKRKAFLSTFLLLIFFSCAYAQVNLDKEKLDKYIGSLGKHDRAMLSLSIAHEGNVIYEKSIGYASKEKNLLSDNQTIYRIGSISKVFTTVMIFQLIEEGKLSLDTKLSDFYPGIKNAEKITVSNLLNHSSGIFNMTNEPSFRQFMVSAKTKDQMVSRIEGLKSDFEPGSRSDYSNSGFVLLGFIVEDLTNTDYPSAVMERVIRKAGLKRTRYGSDINVENNEALPYRAANKEWQAVTTFTDMSIPGGAGAMVSTPTDLTQFINAIFDGTLISSNSLNQMKEITRGYGRGLFEMPFNDKTGYGHGGAIDFFSSNLAYFEEDKLAVSMTVNGVLENTNDIMIAVLSMTYSTPYTLPDFGAEAIDLPEETLLKYEGTFASDAIPLKVTLKVKNGKLTAQASGQNQLTLEAFSEKEFRFEQAGIVITFEEVSDTIDYTRFILKQGGGRFEFKKE